MDLHAPQQRSRRAALPAKQLKSITEARDVGRLPLHKCGEATVQEHFYSSFGCFSAFNCFTLNLSHLTHTSYNDYSQINRFTADPDLSPLRRQ